MTKKKLFGILAVLFTTGIIVSSCNPEDWQDKTPHKITGVEQVGMKNLNIFYEGDILSGEFRIKGKTDEYDINEFYFSEKDGKNTFVVVVFPNLTVGDKITVTAANAEGSATITVKNMLI